MRTSVQQKVNHVEPKVFTLSTETKKNILKLLNLVVVLSLFTFFIYLSLTNNNLFLTEISVGGSIVVMLGVCRILSLE
jgi:hypothetical protein